MKFYSPLFLNQIRDGSPDAVAWIRGNAEHPKLNGIIRFFAVTIGGVLVNAELFGLPGEESGVSHFFGMHIHEVGDCTLPFDQTGAHYNPAGAPHPEHAGDMPPIMSSDGYAWLAFYDDRINVNEIIGRSIIIHGSRDDFTTQPSGDAGEKIGCGVIERA